MSPQLTRSIAGVSKLLCAADGHSDSGTMEAVKVCRSSQASLASRLCSLVWILRFFQMTY